MLVWEYIEVLVESVVHSEIYKNDVLFLFLKKLFLTSTHENDLKSLNFLNFK